MIPAVLAASAFAIIYLLAGAALGGAAVFIKVVPVSILAVALSRRAQSPAQRLGAIALAISALADALIEWRFLFGLGGFLIAHLCYIAAFVSIDSRLRPMRLIPAAAWGCVALPLLCLLYTSPSPRD